MYSYSNTVDLGSYASVRPDSTRSYVSELKTEDQRTAQDRGSCAYVLVHVQYMVHTVLTRNKYSSSAYMRRTRSVPTCRYSCMHACMHAVWMGGCIHGRSRRRRVRPARLGCRPSPPLETHLGAPLSARLRCKIGSASHTPPAWTERVTESHVAGRAVA
jgi:hypothetical protein